MSDQDQAFFDPRIADWLENDPNDAPDQTLQIVLAAFPSIKQRHAVRVPRRFPSMTTAPKLALGAAAVIAVVLGGAYVLGPVGLGPGVGGQPTASPSPSPSPSVPASPAATVPAMTQAFDSPTFGYSIRYPGDWSVTPTTGEGPSPGGADIFDAAGGVERFRVLSRAVPDDVKVEDWISFNLTISDEPDCSRPRDTLEPIVIDGQEGRIRGFCGPTPAPEIEATVIVGDRVYLLTLFAFREDGSADEAHARALFDAFASTMTLSPDDAEGSPSASATIDPPTWTPFTSDRHGFSAAVPPAFATTPATEAWTIPEEPRNGFDTFYGGPGVNTWIAASMPLPAGTTEQAWFDAYREGQGVDVSDPCWPPLEEWSAVTIDGRSAAIGLGCGTLDVLLFVEDRVYNFGAYGPPSGTFGVPDDFRAMFDAWLTTITLDPASALEPAPASPSPSPS